MNRFLKRDGTFNIQKNRKRIDVSDLYHSLLASSWPKFFSGVAVLYLIVNFFFALLYLACGPQALEGSSAITTSERVMDAFFFSVQTLATIGYGKISPHGLAANIIVTTEALTGLLSVALVTGLVFAKFARPTAKVVFSNYALITRH